MNGRAYILQGHARRLPLADACIQNVVTSVPYWGLRTYGTAPQVWGGDALCDHEWGDWEERREVREKAVAGKTRTTDRCYGDASRKFDGNHQKHVAGQFCSRCGAWRGEYGNEPTPAIYVANTLEVFREVRRVLRKDGTVFLNIGDCYHNGDKGGYRKGRLGPSSAIQRSNLGSDIIGAPNRQPQEGLKSKDLVLMPARIALALQADGWWVRDTIIWHKPNTMPSSVTDRTTTAHEYLFLLTKSARYFFDSEAIREPYASTVRKKPGPSHLRGQSELRPRGNMQGSGEAERWYGAGGRNKRSVWTIPTAAFRDAHFATFPPKLVENCVKAGTSERGCCPACGTPWKRVVERIGPDETREQSRRAMELFRAAGFNGKHIAAVRSVGITDTGKTALTQNGTGKNDPVAQALADEVKAKLGGYYRELLLGASVTTHWLPSCKCNAGEPIPCKVLDPFNGSGTTIMVARDLGRVGVGTDLNPEYNAIARRRLALPRRTAQARRAKTIKLPQPEPLLFTEAS